MMRQWEAAGGGHDDERAPTPVAADGRRRARQRSRCPLPGYVIFVQWPLLSASSSCCSGSLPAVRFRRSMRPGSARASRREMQAKTEDEIRNIIVAVTARRSSGDQVGTVALLGDMLVADAGRRRLAGLRHEARQRQAHTLGGDLEKTGDAAQGGAAPARATRWPFPPPPPSLDAPGTDAGAQALRGCSQRASRRCPRERIAWRRRVSRLRARRRPARTGRRSHGAWAVSPRVLKLVERVSDGESGVALKKASHPATSFSVPCRASAPANSRPAHSTRRARDPAGSTPSARGPQEAGGTGEPPRRPRRLPRVRVPARRATT